MVFLHETLEKFIKASCHKQNATEAEVALRGVIEDLTQRDKELQKVSYVQPAFIHQENQKLELQLQELKKNGKVESKVIVRYEEPEICKNCPILQSQIDSLSSSPCLTKELQNFQNKLLEENIKLNGKISELESEREKEQHEVQH